MLACVLRLSFVFHSFESDSDSLYFLPWKQLEKRLWLNRWSEGQNREGWPSCPCLDLQPGFPILGSNREYIIAEKLCCLAVMLLNSDQSSSESRSAFDSMEAKDSRRTEFCLAHGKINNWEPCHHKRRSCQKLHLPAHAEFPSHWEGDLLCKKARYYPLIAGSILSFWEIETSDSSCVSPSKLGHTFCQGRPSWHCSPCPGWHERIQDTSIFPLV